MSQPLDRRSFLASTAALGAAGLLRQPTATTGLAGPAPELGRDLSIADAQAEMAAGRLTARALTEYYLARIRTHDADGPRVNSVIEVNPDALEMAEAMDAERRAGKVRGPLHGIPVLIKDNIDTGDRMTTTAGSLALQGWRARRDAPVVQKLRAAGAVLLGKTNLSEWANFRGNRSSSGWSGRGGQTRNPHVLDRSPCGSSSGSGAAVAADFCMVAIGTETDGSIVCPSSSNGIVGLKPTVGLVSRTGIIPISSSQDTAGPMARTVRDAALLLGAITGRDPADAATRSIPASMPADYTRGLDELSLRGVRIGVARNAFGFDSRVDRVMESAVAVLRDRGARIVDPMPVPNLGRYDEAEFEILLTEFKVGLNAYLAGLPSTMPVHTLAELILWNEQHAAVELQWFGQELFKRAQETAGLGAPSYRRARETAARLARREGLDPVFRRVDVLIGPTGGPAWMIDLVTGDHFGGGISTPSAVSGYPHLTVPAGAIAGLPVGISFLGPAWSEALLLRVGHAFEQATRHRKSPTFLPTLASTPR